MIFLLRKNSSCSTGSGKALSLNTRLGGMGTESAIDYDPNPDNIGFTSVHFKCDQSNPTIANEPSEDTDGPKAFEVDQLDLFVDDRLPMLGV
ncbi:hypothetical protein FRB91_008610 [Serendipita sp. 411]|nr:hypothetical protein FRB91_008610 [Serendipita sp. 411]